MLRIFRLLPLVAILLAPVAQAQQWPITGPLPYDASRAVPPVTTPSAARTTSLSLPFFDDFTSPLEGVPLSRNWLPKGGAFINNRLGVLPLSRGTATLDGLRADGTPYSGTSGATSYGPTDTLTSQPVDLSNRVAADSVYLKFAWQSGSIVGPPSNISGTGHVITLELQFRNQNGSWESKWLKRSTGQLTMFRLVAQAINEARFLHANFQFRFLASGDRTTGQDVWSLDYVLLTGKPIAAPFNIYHPADTTYRDIALTTGMTSPLHRFTAMPWWQYNAAANPRDELDDSVVTGLINLGRGNPTPITWLGTVRDLGSGSTLGTWAAGGRSQQTVPRRDTILGNARRAPLPTTAVAKRLRYTLALNTYNDATGLTLANDTISRDVELGNYYAYDDGTAETFFNAPSGNVTEFVASRFDINTPDQVHGLEVAPIFLSAGNRVTTVIIWENNNGLPGRQLATATANLPNPIVPRGQVFYRIDFPTSVAVGTSFFIGYSQPRNNQSIDAFAVGVDLNNTRPDNTLFYTTNTTWQPTTTRAVAGSNTFLLRGALMLRPVLTNNTTVLATHSAIAPSTFALYPNPAHGTVSIAGPAFARATVLDALGRPVWEQPTAEAGQPTLALGTLPPGLYFVRLTLPDGRQSTQRLALE